MKIFVSAAEISSDLQAEKIIRALLKRYPEGSVELSGIGGPRLRAIPGFKVIEEAESLRAMGFTEVLSKLSHIKAVKARALKALKLDPPDVLITFDYPDFHFSLLKEVQMLPQLKRTLKVSGIPPKVWVWRKNRVQKIREYYDGVWVIFPFEKQFYESHGIPVIFEGNPLISDLLQDSLQKQVLVSEDEVRLAVMPGSREAELKYHLPIIPDTLLRLSQLTKKRVIAEVPIPKGVGSELIERELISSDHVRYQFFKDGSKEVLARNRLGLIKSGTSTLEAAVLGCVPVIFYKVSPVSELIFKFVVRYLGPVGLPNILLGVKTKSQSIFKEFVGVGAKSDLMAVELSHLCEDPARLSDLQSAGESLRRSLAPHADVPAAIAEKLDQWIHQKPMKREFLQRSWKIRIISILWSSVNSLRRSLAELGVLSSQKINIPSVLVGNLQAGGAGKTPMVIALARDALRRGYRVGVVSRGYGAHYSEAIHLAQASESAEIIGDEPAEILRAVPNVRIALSSDRVMAAERLQGLGCNFLIFDDGFQNLKFKPTLTVLLVTDRARDVVPYRDFDAAVKSADFVFLTKGKGTPRFPQAVEIKWEPESLPSQPIWILCGVADPFEVRSYYESLGVRIERMLALPDHAKIDRAWVKNLMEQAAREGAALAVTEKDWVKIDSPELSALVVLRRHISQSEILTPIFERLQ